MNPTPNLSLPYIASAQAQKHVTHNEAIRALDALVQLAVLDRDLLAPPASPADGARYIVAAAASGAWAGHDGKIAAWQDGAWMLRTPREGWIAWVSDENQICIHDGAVWVPFTGSGSVNPVPLVGVNATADATNKLSVASPAILLNHAGAGHQVKINKNAAGDTGSLLYQTGFSGRAEVGLAGDDDFRIKVSADGSAWSTAIVIDRTTGGVSLPNTAPSGVTDHGALTGLGDDDHLQYHSDARGDARYPSIASVTAALAGKISTSEKAAASGVATLDSGGKIPQSQLPAVAISNTFVVASQAAMLALTGEEGDVAVRTDLSKSFILTAVPASTLANWQELLTPASPVQSVAGKVGVVTLVKGDVGLGSSDNTSDTSKPVSTATQTALDAKTDKAGGSLQTATLVGVNATADATNKLSVSSDATLFSHTGAGHQLKINKNAAANTGSFLFQTGFSGRAELGTTGDDDFHFKVSADGSSFREALKIDRTTGLVSLAMVRVPDNLLINGDFQINQRGFAGGALAAAAYGFDRWKADTGGANLTQASQVVTLNSGTIVQLVEAGFTGEVNLASKTFTVSVEDLTGNNLTISLGSSTGNIITPGTGRRSVTLTTAAGDTGNLSLKIAPVGGTATFKRVQLELGAFTSGRISRPRAAELALCQRYYSKSYDEGVSPGTVVTAGCYTTASSNTTVATTMVNAIYPVAMRAAPTVTIYNPATGATGSFDRSATAIAAIAEDIGLRACRIRNSAVTTDGAKHNVHAVFDAEL